MSLLFTPAAIDVLTALWAVCAYVLTARNERLADLPPRRMPLWIAGAIAVAAATCANLLPTPWDLSVPLAVVGLGIAAWSDWHTQYLWLDVTFPTLLLCAGVMYAGGEGGVSVAGGVLCGSLSFALYAFGLLFKKETGFGDVVVAAAIGFALGPIGGICGVLAAVYVHLIGAGIWSVVKKRKFTDLMGVHIGFGPALALGMTIAALALPALNSVYAWFAT